jgi:hypothetical protein
MSGRPWQRLVTVVDTQLVTAWSLLTVAHVGAKRTHRRAR